MKGRPILGVVAGFLFGLLLGPTLWLWGIIELASPLIWILPLVGIVFGLVMAAWAPFGKPSTDEPAPADEPTVDAAVPEQSDAISETVSEPPPGADSRDESSS
ncbi:MAG: hypothetical protein DWP92_11410 [Armatimonadetes bacterium]|nr:MAG: hypothetical protein DWP92_11410 [Armatimonadota bacterium]